MLTLVKGALYIPLLRSMSEAFSVPFLTLIQLCHTKHLEQSILVPGPIAKSSTLEIMNPTSYTSYQCWERLKAGEVNDRGWDGWMASLTRWTWVWVNPGSWWWTGKPGVLQPMGLQRVEHDWVTELNWTFDPISLTLCELIHFSEKIVTSIPI